MNRKRVQPEEAVSSSGEEEDEEEGEETESGSSSSEEDDFDSEDDRVNVVPHESAYDENPLEAAQNDSSSESDEDEEDDDATHVDPKPASAPQLRTDQVVQAFDSDVESEYETESSSESEALTQKPAKNASPIEATEARPPSPKNVGESKGTHEEDRVVKKGKDNALRQQQESSPLISGKRDTLRNLQEDSQSLRKGQGLATKDAVCDGSVRSDKGSGSSLKKRKLESVQQHHDTERDSVGSPPITKKRKDANMVQKKDKKSAAKDTASHALKDTGIGNVSSSKRWEDRKELSHPPSGDAAKEIAKKMLNSIAARANGSKDVVDGKALNVEHESKKEKQSVNQPASSLKPKKVPHLWSVGEEIALASEILNHVKMGLGLPSNTDNFWFTLSGILQEKLGVELSRDQLREKFRRLKQRYQGSVQRIKDLQDSGKPFKHKNSSEQTLFDISSQIWGRAELISLLNQHEVANGVGNKPSKPNQSPCREVKAINESSPEVRPFSNASTPPKTDVVMTTGNNVGGGSTTVVAVCHKPDHLQAVNEAQGKDVLNAPVDGAPPILNDVQRLLDERINKTLNELQEWSKRNLEEWMRKAYVLMEESMKKLEDQVRSMSRIGMGSGGLLMPMRIGDAIEFDLMQQDRGIGQQWFDLHLQELSVHAQRLELMRKECELKQEQMKVQIIKRKQL